MNIYNITTDIGDLNEHLKKIKSIDLTSYATKQYVDDAVAGIDLTSYATTQYVDGKIDSIPQPDLTNYYTKDEVYNKGEVDQVIDDAISGGTADLNQYVKKSELNDMSYVSTDALNDMSYVSTDALNDMSYVSAGDLNEMGYIQSGALSEYAKKSDLTPYATTSSLGEYAKKTDLTPYATTSSLGEYAKKTDLTPYATTSSLGEYAKKTDLTPYATTQYVDDAIGDIDIPRPDLTNYYTKDEVYNKTQTDEQIETAITEAISGGTIDLTQYVKKSELNDMSYVSTSALNDMSYVTASDLDSKGYVTTSALNNMNFAKASDLDGKQDKLSNANVLSGITSTKVSNWDGAATNSHTHSNKTVLDGIKASDISNWNSKTDNAGTITGIKMNGASKGTSGVVDLGTVLTSETDPVFTASAAHGITAQDITNWNNKTDNIGTVTGIKINADTFNPDNTGIVDITNSYNSLWTSYQALMNQVTYLYAHVVWKSDEGGDEPTPEPTGNIYVGFIDTEDINEIDVANLTDVTTTAKSTINKKTSDGITFTCNTGTGGYAWVVVPESYNIQYVYDKDTAATFGDDNGVNIFGLSGTKDGNQYWMAGHNVRGYNDGHTFNIVLLTSL